MEVQFIKHRGSREVQVQKHSQFRRGPPRAQHLLTRDSTQTPHSRGEGCRLVAVTTVFPSTYNNRLFSDRGPLRSRLSGTRSRARLT